MTDRSAASSKRAAAPTYTPLAGPGLEVGAPPADRTGGSTRRWWMLGIAAVALAAAYYVFGSSGGEKPTYLSSAVQRGEIRDAVDATGTVNAVVTVLVGSQVSGTIAKLNADFNTRVHKGDIIAVIDPSLLQGTTLQASADVENARASVVAAEANVAKANAASAQTKADFDRATELAKRRAVTDAELDVARANYETARASVQAAVAGVAQAKAQVSQKDAALAVARTNLDHSIIRSPIDGIVVARNVDVGQTVAASLAAPTIFTIAQDLTKMQVYAKVDESDVGRIKIGHAVSFKVDAFPKQQFTGTVSQVRMNPTTVQNVVTYDAIIDFANPELKLFPGMTAYVTIPVATATDVVMLPNAALRFKPPMSPEQVHALYARHGIDVASARTEAPSDGAGAKTKGHDSGARAATAIVWKPTADGSIEPVQVSLGITDHAYTEVTQVLHGALKPGDDLVTTAVGAKGSSLPGAGPQTIRR